MIYDAAKRVTDVLLSILGLLLLSPVMAVISAWIRIDSPGPVFYRGVRAGRGGEPFKIFKFRSMVADAEGKGGYSTAADDPRVTRVGKFLRKHKLDELPQFFNVLLGKMSLVGPRPQVLFYTDRYTDDERLILTVKPGITDLASLYFADMDNVLGSGEVDERYRTEIEPVKNQLRLRYVNERSYILDLRILVETAFKLLGVENATRLHIEPEKW